MTDTETVPAQQLLEFEAKEIAKRERLQKEDIAKRNKKLRRDIRYSLRGKRLTLSQLQELHAGHHPQQVYKATRELIKHDHVTVISKAPSRTGKHSVHVYALTAWYAAQLKKPKTDPFIGRSQPEPSSEPTRLPWYTRLVIWLGLVKLENVA
jgi:hypothetical protein